MIGSSKTNELQPPKSRFGWTNWCYMFVILNKCFKRLLIIIYQSCLIFLPTTPSWKETTVLKTSKWRRKSAEAMPMFTTFPSKIRHPHSSKSKSRMTTSTRIFLKRSPTCNKSHPKASGSLSMKGTSWPKWRGISMTKRSMRISSWSVLSRIWNNLSVKNGILNTDLKLTKLLSSLSRYWPHLHLLNKLTELTAMSNPIIFSLWTARIWG